MNPPAPPPTRVERVEQAVHRQVRTATHFAKQNRDLVLATIFLLMGFLLGKM